MNNLRISVRWYSYGLDKKFDLVDCRVLAGIRPGL